MITPAGWYHRSCVHEVPNGARVGRDRVVTRNDGTSYHVPECMYPGRRSKTGQRIAEDRTTPPINNGWMEWAQYSLSGDSRFRGLSARWDTPSAPAGSYSTGQVYYTFPGLVSTTGHPYIIQPVLQYGNNGAFGGSYWVAASWHCDDGSDCSYSTPISVSAQDDMLGTVTASDCQSGECSWTIITRDLTRETQSTFVVTDVDQYPVAIGGAVEVYGLSACSQYPSTGVFYSALSLSDHNGQGVTPSWSTTVAANPSPECSFSVSATTYTVDLYHNPPPPPTDWATIVGPDEMKPEDTCYWYVSTNVGDASIEWTVNEEVEPIGTDYELWYSASTSFTLKVLVWNEYGQHANDERSISVSQGNEECLQQRLLQRPARRPAIPH